jgi:multidrug efflux pump subunit AcrB
MTISLGSEFLPQRDEGVIWIRANLPPGTTPENHSNHNRRDELGLLRDAKAG